MIRPSTRAATAPGAMPGAVMITRGRMGRSNLDAYSLPYRPSECEDGSIRPHKRRCERAGVPNRAEPGSSPQFSELPGDGCLLESTPRQAQHDVQQGDPPGRRPVVFADALRRGAGALAPEAPRIPNNDLAFILRQYDIDTPKVKRELERSLSHLKTGSSRPGVLGEEIIDAIREAWVFGSLEQGAHKVRSAHLLAAILSDRGCTTGSPELARAGPPARRETAERNGRPPAARRQRGSSLATRRRGSVGCRLAGRRAGSGELDESRSCSPRSERGAASSARSGPCRTLFERARTPTLREWRR